MKSNKFFHMFPLLFPVDCLTFCSRAQCGKGQMLTINIFFPFATIFPHKVMKQGIAYTDQNSKWIFSKSSALYLFQDFIIKVVYFLVTMYM